MYDITTFCVDKNSNVLKAGGKLQYDKKEWGLYGGGQ